MSISSPEVSVVIPTYNRAHLLPRTLDSVLEQTGVSFEVIVVDDGSTDNTAEVISQYGEKVKYIRKENGGVSSARNIGIANSKGKYITMLDSDDAFCPGFLSEHFRALERFYPDYGLSFSKLSFRDDTKNSLTEDDRVPSEEPEAGLRLLPDALGTMLFMRAQILPSNTMIRMDLLNGKNSFEDKCFCHEDMLFFYNLSIKTGFIHIEKILGVFGPGIEGHYSIGTAAQEKVLRSIEQHRHIWLSVLEQIKDNPERKREREKIHDLLANVSAQIAAEHIKSGDKSKARKYLSSMLGYKTSVKNMVKYIMGLVLPARFVKIAAKK